MNTKDICRVVGFSVVVLTAGAGLVGCRETVSDDERIRWMVSSAAAIHADEVFSAIESGLDGEALVGDARTSD